MEYNYIVWDLDGVMINGQEGVIKAVNHVLKKMKYPEMTEKHIIDLLTAPKVQIAFERICNVSAEVSSLYADMYKDVYLKYYLYDAKLQDGIIHVLEQIHAHSIHQAIATNKRHECAEKLCEHFGFTKYCCPVIGSDGMPGTTKADLINHCLLAMGCRRKEEAVLIGDLPGDKASAKALGIDFLGVNYGFGFKGICGYAHSPEDVLFHVLRSRNKK